MARSVARRNQGCRTGRPPRPPHQSSAPSEARPTSQRVVSPATWGACDCERCADEACNGARCCGHLVAPGLAHGRDEGGGSEGLGQEGDDEREKVGASHHVIRSTTCATVLRATAFESSHINAALPKPLHEEGNRLRGLGTGAAQIGSPPCLIFGVGSLWPCPLLHFLSSCVRQQPKRRQRPVLPRAIGNSSCSMVTTLKVVLVLITVTTFERSGHLMCCSCNNHVARFLKGFT